jgi:hypothetical protein
MPPLISGYYIALTVLAITALSIYVSVRRARTRIWFGDGDDVPLARARRAHYTLLEFGVIFLVALLTFELTGGDKAWIHPLGILFLAGRWLHVMSALFMPPANLARLCGVLASHAATLAVCALLLARLS